MLKHHCWESNGDVWVKWAIVQGLVSMTTDVSLSFLSFEFGMVVVLFALSWELENSGSVVLQPLVVPTLWLAADVRV